MAFGSPKRPDPRDILIDSLRDEIRYLRAMLDEANKTNLALMNSYAYRQRYGGQATSTDASKPTDPEASLTPAQLRARVVEPDFTLSSIEREFIVQGSAQTSEGFGKPKH